MAVVPGTTALSDQCGPSTYTLHGAYYLKDRDSRPKVWYRDVTRSTQLYQIKATLPTYTVHGAYYLKDRDSRPKVWYRVETRGPTAVVLNGLMGLVGLLCDVRPWLTRSLSQWLHIAKERGHA